MKLNKAVSFFAYLLLNNKALILIFLLGVLIRFLYFPNDISFGYDQARDAYISQKALSGDLKIVGPPASVPDIHHGALSYYALGLMYAISNKSPLVVAALFRLVNAAGIIITFFIVKELYKNKTSALIAALFYAISFEQSQLALFLGHPALGIPTALLAFYGLIIFIYRQKKWGLFLLAASLGATIQFHFSSVNLIIASLVIIMFSRKSLQNINLRDLVLAFGLFILSISTYILAELKYGFRQSKTIAALLSHSDGGGLAWENLIKIPSRFVEINIFSFSSFSFLVFLAVLIGGYIVTRKKYASQFFTLVTWLVIGIVPYINYSGAQPSYYYSLSASVALLVVAAVFLEKIFKISRLVTVLIIGLVIYSNVVLITQNNPYGTVAEVNAQEGMLISDALRVVDYTYKKANGDDFSVNALTIPYGINTTWSYIYEWHGRSSYGYLPTWGGEHAEGYENNLEIETAQSELSDIRFTILEPPRGLTAVQTKEFLQNEDRFWELIEEVRHGQFTVQLRNFRE